MSVKKTRLDQRLTDLQLVATRSQAENYIRLGRVRINGVSISKPGHFVSLNDNIQLLEEEIFVGRAGLKLASVAASLNLNFQDAIILDVGSSTGGFTDYALRRGARKVIAVDVGTDQLHPTLRQDPRVELHEKTDIRQFPKPDEHIDIVLIDVSFISLTEILPSIAQLADLSTLIVAMCKPQFEAGKGKTHAGVIKNDTERRAIFKDFEQWLRPHFLTLKKADSEVSGAKGNVERFYLLRKIS